jgi:hypothetical protein
MCGRYAYILPPMRCWRCSRCSTSSSSAALQHQADGADRGDPRGTRAADGPAARWGLVPAGSRTAPILWLLINARIEGIEEKPPSARVVRRHRCIVPASGYFEWYTALTVGNNPTTSPLPTASRWPSPVSLHHLGGAQWRGSRHGGRRHRTGQPRPCAHPPPHTRNFRGRHRSLA